MIYDVTIYMIIQMLKVLKNYNNGGDSSLIIVLSVLFLYQKKAEALGTHIDRL